MDALTEVPFPANESVLDYSPGSAERKRLEAVAAELSSRRADLPRTIGGERRMGGCEPVEVVQPHRHNAVLGTLRGASARDAADGIEAARQAAPAWRALPFDERAAIMLRAAELLSGRWRAKLNAATMLGQSKTPVQAEIDAAGTNDKAGSIFNLLRWVSPRSIKESFAPAVSSRYLHQGPASRPSA